MLNLELGEIYTGPMTAYDQRICDGLAGIMEALDAKFTPDHNRFDREEFIMASITHPRFFGQLVSVRGEVLSADEPEIVVPRVLGGISLSQVGGAGHGWHGQMEDVIVDPEVQGQGIGKRLYGAVDDWMIQHRLPFLMFETEEFREAAVASYARWGAYRVTDGTDNSVGLVYRKDYDLAA